MTDEELARAIEVKQACQTVARMSNEQFAQAAEEARLVLRPCQPPSRVWS